MSTIFYDAMDLANVISCAQTNEPDPDVRKALQTTMAHALHAYSVANCKAYKERYEGRHGSDKAKPWPVVDILFFVGDQQTSRPEDCKHFLQLAVYNLDDFDSPAMRQIIEVFKVLCSENGLVEP